MDGTQIIPYLTCRDAAEAVEFYRRALGAEAGEPTKMPDGRIVNVILTLGGASLYLMMDEMPEYGAHGPQEGSQPVSIILRVPNADAIFHRAVEAGCTVTMPLEDTFWGDRYGAFRCPYGHSWSVATQIREVTAAEMDAALAQMTPECER